MPYTIDEYIPGKIYIVEYPIHYGGMDLFSRMTLVRLRNGTLWVHSPCQIDDQLANRLKFLGNVAYIVAPGTFHHLYVADCQRHFPQAETFICPGLEKKREDLRYDWILGNRPDQRWQSEFDQVAITAARLIAEVAFFHKDTRTLILVDLLENIGDDYSHDAGRLLKFWWKAVFHMWNNPKAAPEYQMAWGNRDIVKKGLETILSWDFERIILAHGNIIEVDARAIAARAWQNVLQGD